MRSVKGLDLFKKLPNDHSPQTVIGGAFTLLATAVMCALFLLECRIYLNPVVVRDTVVDGARQDYIQVNVNVTLHSVPCAMAAIDIQDSAGGHSMNLGNTLQKLQFDANGDLRLDQQLDTSIQAIQNAIDEGDYCRLEGNFKVGSLPGNFHMSFHTPAALFHMMLDQDLRKMRLDHTLSHLSFGANLPFSPFSEEKLQFFAPYDNLQVNFPPDGQVYTTNYFIKVIPIQFLDQSTGTVHSSYEYSMNYQSQRTEAVFGAIYFHYDIDCITVKYTRKSSSLARFLVNVCAIVGGAYTVIGICHSLAQQTLRCG